jgi:hypothetical protein
MLDHTYILLKNDFEGRRGARMRCWRRMPSFIMLFEMFSPMVMLIKIVEETNYYTTTLDVEKSLTPKVLEVILLKTASNQPLLKTR